MLRCVPILLTIAMLATAGKKQPAPLMTGKVLDSEKVKTLVLEGTDTLHSLNVQNNQLLLLGVDFAYVIEDTRIDGVGHGLIGAAQRTLENRHKGCHFIIGDSVQYWQDKDKLHIYDADGKECKVDILRQERLKPVNPPNP